MIKAYNNKFKGRWKEGRSKMDACNNWSSNCNNTQYNSWTFNWIMGRHYRLLNSNDICWLYSRWKLHKWGYTWGTCWHSCSNNCWYTCYCWFWSSAWGSRSWSWSISADHRHNLRFGSWCNRWSYRGFNKRYRLDTVLNLIPKFSFFKNNFSINSIILN